MSECKSYKDHEYIVWTSTNTNDECSDPVNSDHCIHCAQHWLASFNNYKNKLLRELQKEQN